MTFDADEYAKAHADADYFPCPHCALGVPRDPGKFCPHCGWHIVTGTPHPLTDEETGQTSSSGRKPTASAIYRAEALAKFAATAKEPPLAEQLNTNDRVLADLRARRRPRRPGAPRDPRRQVPVRQRARPGRHRRRRPADRLQARPSTATRDDVEDLMQAFWDWQQATDALTKVRHTRAQLLDRWSHAGIYDPKH